MKVKVRVEDQTYSVEIEDLDTNPVIAVVEGKRFEVWAEAILPHPPRQFPCRSDQTGTRTGSKSMCSHRFPA